MQQAINDPNFVVQFAVGDPIPNLIPQNPNDNKNNMLTISGIYYNKPKRYILKNAHISYDDNRIFDCDTGKVVMVSHHPGKNPYDAFDPLGITDNNMYGTEFKSLLTITGYNGFPNEINIRPKTLSRHGRQYISYGNNTIMTVGKLSKLKTKSFRPHFGVIKGKKGHDGDKKVIYKCVADMMGRTVSILNGSDELVAQMSKSTKALIQMATSLGSGTESTIDIAPGVDCSVILAIVYGIGQIGKHLVKDTAQSAVVAPIQGAVVDEVINNVAGMDEGANIYEDVVNNAEELHSAGMFIFESFFQ